LFWSILGTGNFGNFGTGQGGIFQFMNGGPDFNRFTHNNIQAFKSATFKNYRTSHLPHKIATATIVDGMKKKKNINFTHRH